VPVPVSDMKVPALHMSEHGGRGGGGLKVYSTVNWAICKTGECPPLDLDLNLLVLRAGYRTGAVECSAVPPLPRYGGRRGWLGFCFPY